MTAVTDSSDNNDSMLNLSLSPRAACRRRDRGRREERARSGSRENGVRPKSKSKVTGKGDKRDDSANSDSEEEEDDDDKKYNQNVRRPFKCCLC